MDCKEALRLIIEKGWLKEIPLNEIPLPAYGYTKAETKEISKEISKLVSFLTEFIDKDFNIESTSCCNCEEALELIIKNNLFGDIVVATTDSLENAELIDFIQRFKENLKIKIASSKPIVYTIDLESFEIKKDDFGFSSIRGRTIPKIRHINVGKRKGKKLVCVVFEDGSHVIKECHQEDEFDINVGVALCLVEKYYSTANQFHKLVNKKLTGSSKEILMKWKEDDKTRATSKRSTK